MFAPRRRARILVGAATLVGVLGSAGCSGTGDSQQTTSAPAPEVSTPVEARLITRGTLVVCPRTGFRPFEYRDGDATVGFDVDLANWVAQRVGATVTFAEVPFARVTSGAAFTEKQCDLATGIIISERRRKNVSFSEPYFDSEQALLVRKGSGITDLAGLRGKRLAVQEETTGLQQAEKDRSANGYSIVAFEDGLALANAVLSGAVDAGLNDSAVMLNYVKDNPETEVVTRIQTQEQYGVAVAKDNESLLQVVNDTLQAAREDGRYDATYRKYLGGPADAVVPSG